MVISAVKIRQVLVVIRVVEKGQFWVVVSIFKKKGQFWRLLVL